MELKWLEDFVMLANMTSFSRAAEARHVTQSAFSRRIKQLETWLGTTLVSRASLPDEARPASTDEPDAERRAVRSAGVVNRAMERLIRQNPGQYLWGYHRYKAPRALAEPAPAPASDASA